MQRTIIQEFETLDYDQQRFYSTVWNLQHFFFLSPPAADWIGSGTGGFISTLVLTPSPILDVDIGVIGSSFMAVSSVRYKVYMKDQLKIWNKMYTKIALSTKVSDSKYSSIL